MLVVVLWREITQTEINAVCAPEAATTLVVGVVTGSGSSLSMTSLRSDAPQPTPGRPRRVTFEDIWVCNLKYSLNYSRVAPWSVPAFCLSQK